MESSHNHLPGGQMSFRTTLSSLWTNIQQQLFPMIEFHVGELPSNYKKLIALLEIIRIEDAFPCTRFNRGRPGRDKKFIARAFIAKSVLRIQHTNQIIHMLEQDKQLRVICGWEVSSKIPSPSKFSRAFKEMSEKSLLSKVHEVLVSKIYEDKIVHHIIKDSTPIIGREKAFKKEGTTKERKALANKRYLEEKKGKLLSRRKKQLQSLNLDEAINELPSKCDMGSKINAQGYLTPWKGYKLHVALTDECIPTGAILTSASLNDCEVAIPLANKSNRAVKNFYDLMDAAYDVDEVKEHSRILGHVPIIDQNPRGKVKKLEKEAEWERKKILNFRTAEDKRYKERFAKERFNASMKDYFGGRGIFYRGSSKVYCHLMFGIIAFTATTVFNFTQ